MRSLICRLFLCLTFFDKLYHSSCRLNVYYQNYQLKLCNTQTQNINNSALYSYFQIKTNSGRNAYLNQFHCSNILLLILFIKMLLLNFCHSFRLFPQQKSVDIQVFGGHSCTLSVSMSWKLRFLCSKYSPVS